MRIFSFRNLWRINAVIIFLAGLLAVSISLMVIFQMTSRYQYSDFESEGDFAYESERSQIFAGRVGSILAFSKQDSMHDFPHEGRNNVIFVDGKSGRTMAILPDGSDEKIIYWYMLRWTVDGQDEGLGYIVMKAKETDLPRGLATVEVGTFKNMDRFTVGKGIRTMDAAQAINESEFSVVLSEDGNSPNLVIVNLVDMKVSKQIPLNLPDIPKDSP